MLFSSLAFILGFLPLTLAAVWIAKRVGGVRAALVVLLVASLVFYAWQTPLYILLIGASIAVNYTLGNRIVATGSRLWVTLGVVFNLCLLGWFKYAGLFSTTISDLSRVDITIDGVVLPLAISFFTFQQIAFLADCLHAQARRYRFVDYALFVAFFPQLIAGPIVHHADLTPQFSGPRFVRFRADDIAAGLFLFSIGLSKKVLIADGLAPIADGVFDAAADGYGVLTSEAWLGALAYSFQIYFDFSGYTDMALGLALLFGVQLPQNFNSPYKARNIADFWRRWHITLSTFLRDYLYFPLGGNRKGPLYRYRNLFIVMLLGGLWHGAAWTFVVWGGLHGAYLCVNHTWDRFMKGRVIFGSAGAMAITFLATLLAWVFFRAETFDAAFAILAALAGAGV
ncbi:MAG: MBOAT family O-acyltransferase, partial [Hyphococcus sp.]